MKLNSILWFKLFLVLIGGLIIEIGVVLVNSSYKLHSALMIILGSLIFLYGLIKLD